MTEPAVLNETFYKGMDYTIAFDLSDEGSLSGRAYLAEVLKKEDNDLIISLTTDLTGSILTLTGAVADINTLSTVPDTYVWICYYTIAGKKYPVFYGDIEVKDFKST